MNGLVKGNSKEAACGVVFREFNGAFKGCFAMLLGLHSSFYAEIFGIIVTIEEAANIGWQYVWFESDSTVALSCLQNPRFAPLLCIYNRWINYRTLIKNMVFRCSHIFREENSVVDCLAILDLSCFMYTWWDKPPIAIRKKLFDDAWGYPKYHFIT